MTLVIGIVVTGAMPSAAEWTGAALTTLGLVTAIGLIRLLSTRTPTLAKG